MRRLTNCFAALAIVFAACGGGDDTAATPSTTQDTVTTTSVDTSTSSTTASSTTLAEEGMRLAQSCESADGFSISYPEDWDAVSGCGQFGPEPVDEPAPSTDERTGVVSAFIDPIPFEQVIEPTEGDRARREVTVDGRPAVRVEGEVAGESLYPRGTEYVRWLVDVSGDGNPATLFVDAYDLGDDIDFARTVDVLDAMAASIELDDR